MRNHAKKKAKNEKVPKKKQDGLSQFLNLVKNEPQNLQFFP